MRKFDPWIGSLYHAEGIEGVRLLILGESHYGKPEDERSTFTVEMVRLLGQKYRHRFFTRIQKLVMGYPTSFWLSMKERADFWERVAFCNFVQSFPGNKARVRPTPEMWANARKTFPEVLQEVSPNLLLVLGIELGRNLPPLPPSLRVCIIAHPAAYGFRYEDWLPGIRMAITEAGAT